MKGCLVVCEGIDCSGKTTAINKILDSDDSYEYSKGIGSDSFLGKTARKFPSTLMFFLELMSCVLIKIKPNLKRGKTILQDRYDISITSYVPLSNRWYNKFLIKSFKPFLIKPGAVVYFHLTLQERIKRLRKKGTKYERILADSPDLITLREKEYLKWFNSFEGHKIKIDTKQNNIEQTANLLQDFILKIV